MALVIIQYTKFVLAIIYLAEFSFSRPFCVENSRAKKVIFPLNSSYDALTVFPPCAS